MHACQPINRSQLRVLPTMYCSEQFAHFHYCTMRVLVVCVVESKSTNFFKTKTINYEMSSNVKQKIAKKKKIF
jgi:hypothetical protein